MRAEEAGRRVPWVRGGWEGEGTQAWAGEGGWGGREGTVAKEGGWERGHRGLRKEARRGYPVG